jgi:GMP synthase-like glutamine amidotransferase
MKKVLVFRHVSHEGLGSIEPYLKELQVPIDYRNLFLNDPIPDSPSDYDFVISMGGPMNVDETEKFPFLLKERAFIAQAIGNGIPVLGICLGAQMIARALKARVYAGPKKEIGWYPIRFTKEALTDPLLGEVAHSEPMVFHWHGDTFDLPEGAVLLASTDLFRHQAFRFGSHVYAFQFHIEVTPDMIKEWILKGEEELNSVKPPVSKSTILDSTSKYEAPLKRLAEEVYKQLFTSLNACHPREGGGPAIGRDAGFPLARE